MDAYDLKAEILGWLRYIRKQEIVCTEVGPYSADCWGLSETRLIEVETKVTFTDLKADLKKTKHMTFQRAPHLRGVPNLFYFAVTPELVDKAADFLKENEAVGAVKSYGLLCVVKPEGYLGRQTRIVKEAEKLHTRKPTDVELRAATLRMGSEICILHDINRRQGREFDAARRQLATATRVMYSEAEKLREQQKENEPDESTVSNGS